MNFRATSNSNFADHASKCGYKKRYSKRSHAEAMLLRMTRGRLSSGTVNSDSLAVYRCKYCDGFHVGHQFQHHN